MSDVEDLIDSYAEDVTLTRYAAGSWVSGNYVEGAGTDSTIRMSVQPLSGKDLLNLPEAQRTRRWMKGYTATAMMVCSESSKQRADRVAYDDTVFEVQTVERWRGDLNHFKVLMAEVNA